MMDDYKVDRRKVIKHTAAATGAVTLFAGSGSASNRKDKTRLLESAIVYDVKGGLDDKEYFDSNIICSGGGYSVENQEVKILPSPKEDDIRSILKNNS